MRGLFSRTHPSFDRLLVVESGPRSVTEKLLPNLYDVQKSRHIDLLTCYGGSPLAFDLTRGSVFSIHDSTVAGHRRNFVRTLSRTPYTVLVIFCASSSVLQRWKWLLALRTRAKVLIVNEHAGYFFLDYWNRRTLGLMLSLRLHLGHEINFGLFAEMLAVPFTIAFLTLYALGVHARRIVKTRSFTS